MGLGKHLVRELDFEDGVDTLGRWMAHYLAELIDEAETAATAAKRSAARKQATDTILKIWEHRLSLPGEAYPLASYKDVLKVLERLRPSDNPYRFFGHGSESKKDQLASILFDNFTRLILALLLMRTRSLEEKKRVDGVAIEALSDEEQRIWNAIREWAAIFPATLKKTGSTRKSKKASDVSRVNLNASAVGLIDVITTTLVALRNALQETESTHTSEIDLVRR